MKKMRKASLIAIRSFLMTTVVLGTVAAVGCYYMYSKEAESDKQVIRNNGKIHNTVLSQTISLDLKSMFNDLQVVANHVEVRRFLGSKDPATRADLESEFITLCRISESYDQVRILDNGGVELVRVNFNNGHPAAVPSNQLQNKWDRYYFQESLKLESGEVYVSPFDLNIENGKIEQPLKPMIRVSMPVYNDSGQRLGIVILNYLGQRVLDTLSASIGEFQGQSMLLNSDGYWLMSPDKTQEWAFMYKDRKSITFGNINPEAWEQMAASPGGQFSTAKGMYMYSTISVAPETRKKEIVGTVPQWTIVCMIPKSVIEAKLTSVFHNYAVLYFYIFLLILFGGLTRARFIYSRAQGQRKLEKAKQEAEIANRAKSDFLARMSHEIRTPMNAIIGLTHLALQTELTPKLADYLTKVDKSAKSLLGIINDILDFSKIEAGRLDVEKVEFILDDVLNDIVNMLGLQAEQKGLEFLLMVKSTVPNLLIGDRLRLGQVLLNLIGNAIKFTESGAVIISAELVEETNDKAVIQFSIKDTGIGVSLEQAAKLFQPFSQADGSISRQFGGTGLGLAISKRLVELMGGTVRLESEVGKGSEFIATIPFELAIAHTEAQLVYPEEIRGLRVLVVDDSKMSRMVLTKVLQSFTFEVTTAESGGQALELLHQSDTSAPFKLVLTDWRLPDIDGIELVQKIKGNSLLENIPKVIMLTAYSQAEIRQRVEQVHLDGFMLKPFNRSILFDSIMEIFAHDGTQLKKIRIEKTQTGVPRNVSGARVLLAEDNEINQQVSKEILEGAGVVVSIADNGQKAVEMVKANVYDAVLMDIQMPVMDGFQAVKKIRSDEKLREIPIIAMTAHALVGDKEKSLLAGMSDHVTKPIDPDVLMNVLGRWLPDRSEPEAERPRPVVSHDASLIVDLPGIDTVQALARVRGNSRLYKKLLVSFVVESASTYADLHSLVSDDKFEEAVILAHTMKGFSGNIGANTLFTLLQELETALKDHSGAAMAMLQAIDSERTLVADGILKAFPQEEGAAITEETGVVHREEVKAMGPQLKELSELLKDHDIEARDVYQSIKSELTHAAPQFAQELGTLLDKFDFVSGHARVRDLITECDMVEDRNG